MMLFTTGEWILLTVLTSIFSSLIGACIYMAATKQILPNNNNNNTKNQQQNNKYDKVPINYRL